MNPDDARCATNRAAERRLVLALAGVTVAFVAGLGVLLDHDLRGTSPLVTPRSPAAAMDRARPDVAPERAIDGAAPPADAALPTTVPDAPTVAGPENGVPDGRFLRDAVGVDAPAVETRVDGGAVAREGGFRRAPEPAPARAAVAERRPPGGSTGSAVARGSIAPVGSQPVATVEAGARRPSGDALTGAPLDAPNDAPTSEPDEDAAIAEEAEAITREQAAIDRGQRWLVGAQREDGSFSGSYVNAATGIALMALVASPRSVQVNAEAIDRAIRYLASAPRSHRHNAENGIPLMALVWAHAKAGRTKTATAIVERLTWVAEAQQEDGGWGYQPVTGVPAETFITDWVARAVLEADAAGFRTPDQTRGRIAAWADRIMTPDGEVLYSTQQTNVRTSAQYVGLFVRWMLGGDSLTSAKYIAGRERAEQSLENAARGNLLMRYHATLYFALIGGAPRDRWQAAVLDPTLRLLEPLDSQDVKTLPRELARDGTLEPAISVALATLMAAMMDRPEIVGGPSGECWSGTEVGGRMGWYLADGPAEWQAAWKDLGLPGDPAPVDFARARGVVGFDYRLLEERLAFDGACVSGEGVRASFHTVADPRVPRDPHAFYLFVVPRAPGPVVITIDGATVARIAEGDRSPVGR